MIGVIQADTQDSGVRPYRRDEFGAFHGHRRATRDMLVVDVAVGIAPELAYLGQRPQFAARERRNYDSPFVTDTDQTHLFFPPGRPR